MKKFVITIGREFGSQGHEIGVKLAEKLNVKYYDKAYFENVMLKSKYVSEYTLAIMDQNAKNGVPIKLWSAPERNAAKEMFEQQEKLINVIANEESCIFIGRCADYILKKRLDTFNVYIYSPYSVKLNHLINKYGLTVESTERMINCMDQSRHNYYKYFTKDNRGERHDKHILIDSSFLGIDYSVKLLNKIVEQKFN